MAACCTRSCCNETGALFAITLGAAVLAGFFTTAVQKTQAIGVIVDAEAYEAESPANGTIVDGQHEVEEEEWAPADGAARHLCSMASNILVDFGFGLILVGAYHSRNLPVGGLDALLDAKQTVWGGICWGAAGFVVFGIAPGLGLPPELPGMVAAELTARQGWWVYCTFFTFVGLALLVRPPPSSPPLSLSPLPSCALTRTLPPPPLPPSQSIGDLSLRSPKYIASRCLGLLLLLLPQLTGSPDYDHIQGAADRPPPEMAAHFVISALVAQGLSWLSIGVFTALGYNRYFRTYGETANLVAGKRQTLEEEGAAATTTAP